MCRSIFKLTGLGIPLLLAGILCVVRAQTPNPPNHEDRARAVGAVRIINTVEYSFRHEKGRFGSWPEIYSSGLLSDMQKKAPRYSAVTLTEGPEIIPGYRLDLLVSAEGTAYSLALHATGDKSCGFTVFSDQSGIIYQGKAIDCPID